MDELGTITRISTQGGQEIWIKSMYGRIRELDGRCDKKAFVGEREGGYIRPSEEVTHW